jgi:hypothetical protein
MEGTYIIVEIMVEIIVEIIVVIMQQLRATF